MNDIPSAIHDDGGYNDRDHGGGGFPTGFGWNDSAELHKCEDGGGLFHRFKTIRRGTVADLIQFVMGLPEDRQPDYAIQKDGDHRLTIGEIRNLARRADFPKNDG